MHNLRQTLLDICAQKELQKLATYLNLVLEVSLWDELGSRGRPSKFLHGTSPDIAPCQDRSRLIALNRLIVRAAVIFRVDSVLTICLAIRLLQVCRRLR